MEGVAVRRWGCKLLVLIGLGGCSGSSIPYVPPPPAPPVNVPDWVYHTPQRSGQVCATGAVDPTFYRQDGRVNAAESARNELARTIEVKITSVMYDEQTTSGNYIDQAIVTEVMGAVTEGVISGAELLEYWFDHSGAVSRQGMTYALACMRTDQSAADLAEKLKAAYPEEKHADRIQQVRERAKVAFDQLERMEDAKLKGSATSTAT